jgi:hypothetical protein
MNQWKSAHAVETDRRTLAEALDGRRRGVRPVGERAPSPPDDPLHGPSADHLRHGEPGPGDHAGGGGADPRRRDHRHRPLRLPEPGQQRPRLPLHLPRRARRSRHHHQHGDEDRGRAGAGRARARGRAGRGRGGLPGLAPPLRARLHHPRPLRPAPDPHGAAGGRQGRHGYRRRAPAHRGHAGLQGAALRPPRSGGGNAEPHLRARAQVPQAGGVRGGRGGAGDPRRPFLREPGPRHGHSRRAARTASPRPPLSRASTSKAAKASRSTTPGSRTATASTRSSSTSACSARASCFAIASASSTRTATTSRPPWWRWAMRTPW